MFCESAKTRFRTAIEYGVQLLDQDMVLTFLLHREGAFQKISGIQNINVEKLKRSICKHVEMVKKYLL